MFPQQPQQQFRTTNADVQLFYRDSTWNKPVGVDHVYMMLIGGGGNGTSGNGGASGAVTVWYGAARNVPDTLNVVVSTGNSVNTQVQYRGSNGLNTLLSAVAATTVTAGTAMTANQFTASGFFQSVAGQTQPGNVASTTTFLNAGNDAGNTSNVSQYGYNSGGVNSLGGGYFLLQPIIVGVGGHRNVPGGIGCGGGGTGIGGPGLVIVASW